MLVADGLATRPPQVAADCGRSRHHLRQHNHSLSEAVIRVTATSERTGGALHPHGLYNRLMVTSWTPPPPRSEHLCSVTSGCESAKHFWNCSLTEVLLGFYFVTSCYLNPLWLSCPESPVGSLYFLMTPALV